MLNTDTIEAVFSLMDHTSDAAVWVDAQQRIQRVNAAAERFWGRPGGSVIGLPVTELLPKEQARAIAAGCLDAPLEIRVARPDGSVAWGSLTATRLTATEAPATMVFVRDTTAARNSVIAHRQLALGLDATNSAVVITDNAMHIVHVNSSFTRLLGWTAAEVLGRRPRDLLFASPFRQRPDFDDIDAGLGSGRDFRTEELIFDSQHRPLWCSIHVTPTLDEAGQLSDSVMVITDITDALIHEGLQHRVLAAMVQEEPIAAVTTLICEEVQRLAPEIIASILRVDEEGRLHPLAGPSLPESYSKQLDGLSIGPATGSCGTAAYRGEPVLVADIATDPLWADYKHLVLPLGLVACWSSPIKRKDGRVVGTFAFYYRDRRGPTPLHERLVELSVHLCAIALERETTQARIRQLAFYDGLTGLPNRSLLHAQAERAIAHANHAHANLAVLFVDLDRFKQVNDSLGQTAGNELLRTVARRLLAAAGESSIVGRMSGDEFVVVVTPCDATHAADIAEQLQGALAAPFQVGAITLMPSASIGIALFPENGPDMDTLLHRADLAMNQAKAGDRGGFSFFSNEMNLLAQERLALEAALREALHCGQLRLHYQPQINLERRHLYGVEALARWTHPELGTVSPMRFIQLAEECGLIGELSHWALREACRQLAEWRRGGLVVPAVSVNLSPTNFHDPGLPRVISAALADNALAPTDLTVEITESALMDTNPRTMTTIREVHGLGVRLALDDFGTGYSSLSYLRRLPVSELKLDKSFLGELVRDEATRALTSAIIRIGESLRLTVVAEGVEDDDQRRVLKEQGYHVAQGYLYSPPMPATELEPWLRRNGL